MNNLSIYINTYMLQNIYMGLCKCIWQIFTLASCKCKNNNIHANNMCKCKKFGNLSVNDLHLHGIFTLYIWLLRHTQHWSKWIFSETNSHSHFFSFFNLGTLLEFSSLSFLKMCVMEMEFNLVLNHIGLKFLVKMIKIEKI
jgi:hypothetical protein